MSKNFRVNLDVISSQIPEGFDVYKNNDNKWIAFDKESKKELSGIFEQKQHAINRCIRAEGGLDW